MNSRIIKNRIKVVRHMLNRENIDSLLVTKPANVTYTTRFSGGDSWAVITGRNVYLLTDSRYTEQAQNECPSCRVIERTTSIARAAAKLIKKIKTVRTVAVEKSVSLADYEAFKRAVKVRLKTVANIIEQVRSVKDSSEIAAIKKASQIAAKALEKTLPFIKQGITENELAGMLDLQIRRLGARNSFDTIVAFGPNASRPHHQPTKRKLKKNDTILTDFGVRYGNCCCDLTRCFAVGKPTALYKKVYNAVQQAQAAAIRMIRAGVDVKEVDAAARNIIARQDLPVYGHGTGHGLGLEVHEEPVLSRNRKGKLKAGMVCTIEPGVYIPGKLGVRIEDDVLVTQTGCKILNKRKFNIFGTVPTLKT
jgi:Xaa-Pro aminopeptidase